MFSYILVKGQEKNDLATDAIDGNENMQKSSKNFCESIDLETGGN